MQKKLLYYSFLYTALNASTLAIGMNLTITPNTDTFLAIGNQQSNKFTAFTVSCRPKIFTSKNEFENNWKKTARKISDNNDNYPTITTSNDRAQLMVFDKENNYSEILVSVQNKPTMVTLGYFKTSIVETIKEIFTKDCNTNTLALFNAGCYYRCDEIFHHGNTLDIRSERVRRIDEINRKIITLKKQPSAVSNLDRKPSRISNQSIYKLCLLTAGTTLGILWYLFPEKFPQFFQFMKCA